MDIVIKVYPKRLANEEYVYDNVDNDIAVVDFSCILDEGVNIRGHKDDGSNVNFVEIDEKQAIGMAKAILNYYESI